MPRTNTQQLPFAIRPLTCRGIFVDVRTTAHTRDKTTLVRNLPAKPGLLALPLFHRPRITPSCAHKRMVISTPNPMANKANMIPCRPCAFGILRGQAVARGSFDNFRGNSDSSPLNLRTSKDRNRVGRVRSRKAVFRLVGEDQ